jgi:hypothetical protein
MPLQHDIGLACTDVILELREARSTEVASICVDRRSSYVVDFLANDETTIPGKVFSIAFKR